MRSDHSPCIAENYKHWAGEQAVNEVKTSKPWAGYVILVLLLIILSIVAFILSNIEGFLAGVIVIFMGFILSFFRDDLRRILGLSKQKQAPPTAPPKSDKEDKEALEGLMLDKLEMDITKEREKIEKAIDDGAIAQFIWTVDQVGQDVSQLMNPEGNPDAEAVFDAESYDRIKQYKNDNFTAWKEQLEPEDFDRVVGLFKQLRSEFPEEIVNAAQPS